MKKIFFISNRYHFIFCFLILASSYISNILSLILLILYILIFFLFRKGKQYEEKVDFDNYSFLDSTTFEQEIKTSKYYSPAYSTVVDVSQNNRCNIIVLKIPLLSILHSWTISSIANTRVKSVASLSQNSLYIEFEHFSQIIKSSYFFPLIKIDKGDIIASKAIYGYLPFGGTITIELPLSFNVLITKGETLRRLSSIIATIDCE